MEQSLEHNLILFVIIGTIGMFILAGAIIVFVFIYQRKLTNQQIDLQRLETEYQQDLLKSSIEAQERERKRIAQDLHDDIGALLSTVKLGFYPIKKSAKENPNQLAIIQSTSNTLEEAISRVRQISKNLLPPTLEKFGLANALENFANKMSIPDTFEIEFVLVGAYKRLEFEKELGLYRVVQELMNNIAKHAGASYIVLQLEIETEQILLSITDNGKGFNPESFKKNKKSSGLGLRNIDSRLSLVPATLRYNPDFPKGSQAIICIPIQ